MTAPAARGRSRFPFLTTGQWLLILRTMLGLYMVAHGTTRTLAGTVDDFGGFLGSKGLPAGVALAWLITATEVIGGLTLAAGRLVRPIAGAFALEHAFGIALVHAPQGWFTVGYQSGGAEYSVLLLVCFLLTAATANGAGTELRSESLPTEGVRR